MTGNKFLEYYLDIKDLTYYLFYQNPFIRKPFISKAEVYLG